ncbi:hypothetical protein [Algoriphagus winogradskyi]|nr:hypothetical protein [Algoriphagus winogradskyi]
MRLALAGAIRDTNEGGGMKIKVMFKSKNLRGDPSLADGSSG